MAKEREARQYPYLPQEYSEPYTPTLAEWETVRLNATGPTGGVTDKLIIESTHAYLCEDSLELSVNIHPQPGVVLGEEGFAPYFEAADEIMKLVRLSFSGIADEDVQIHFFIRGSAGPTWQGGKMTFEGQE